MFKWIKTKISDRPATGIAAPDAAIDPVAASRALHRQGNAWLDKGNIGAALASYEKAVERDPLAADSRVSLGYVLSELGRFEDARRELADAVRLDASSSDGFYLLGSAERALSQTESAIGAWRSAILLKPDFDPCRRDLILALVQTGDLTGAEAVAKEGLVTSPQFADMPYLLGNIQATRGEVEQAVDSYAKALEISPDYAQVHQALGEALKRQGKVAEAVESHRRSVTLSPASSEARARLGAALHDLGQLVPAIAAYRQSLALGDGQAEVHVNLGYALQQAGQLASAVESYRQAIALRPDLAEPYTKLGDALTELSHLDEALKVYRHALTLQPDDARTYNNMAGALIYQGRLDEAVENFEKALALVPDYIAAYSNMLFALNYHPDKSAEDIFATYKEFDRRFGGHSAGPLRSHSNDRSVARRLKVGYLSPDFRRHAVRHFVLPLIDHHDKAAVEVHAYSDVLLEDEDTGNYKRSADRWIPVVGMSDYQVAERIRADGIDILVDLAGHTGKNRIGVFVRRPAPVAVSWLGFGYTTGLSAIDYFLTDATAAPPDSDHLFAERPWRIATPSYTYRPTTGMGEVGPLPSAARGFVTFGTLTRAIRMNHRVFRVWSQVLHRVPGSRLVIDSVNYVDGAVRDAHLAAFAAHGIGAERLDVGFHTPPWDTMRSVDIGLDCFPHNSGTTLFETLYMGLPYVTLAGRPSVGRLGSTILEGAGHPEWITHSEEEYIDKAVALATDLPRLAAIRACLRSEMRASALMDEGGFARKVEAAYREMFAFWAARQ